MKFNPTSYHKTLEFDTLQKLLHASFPVQVMDINMHLCTWNVSEVDFCVKTYCKIKGPGLCSLDLNEDIIYPLTTIAP